MHPLGCESVLLPETQTLVDQAEARSGKPVFVYIDRELDVSATIQVARRGALQHVLRVKPSDALDYFVANQVLFMLRMVELPADQRFDCGPTGVGDTAMAEVVQRQGPARWEHAAQAPDSVASRLANWAVMQVRSIPIGMRVDQQIFRDMPALRASLEAGVTEQNRDNLQAIQRIRTIVSLPERYFWPASAYALFSDRLLGRSLLSVPFDALGLSSGGRSLLRLYDELPRDPSSDRQLVDAWAQQIGLSDWYRWTPYEP